MELSVGRNLNEKLQTLDFSNLTVIITRKDVNCNFNSMTGMTSFGTAFDLSPDTIIMVIQNIGNHYLIKFSACRIHFLETHRKKEFLPKCTKNSIHIIII